MDKLLRIGGEIPFLLHNIFRQAICCFLLIYFFTPVQSQVSLTPNAEITLLTCDPGAQLYSTYGHTCFRVFDPENGLDDVYNYGTFDFETPGFYRKFVQGKLNYILSIGDYQAFRRWYMANHRTVYEQLLLITPEEKQSFYEFLFVNSQPENREYLYDYFFKNCSSVPRDILFDQLGDSFIPDSTLHEPGDQTFRELIHEKLIRLPWPQFGIDLILGMKIDRKATPYEKMFLPEHLMDFVSRSRRSIKGKEIPLAHPAQEIVFGEPLSPYKGILPIHVTWAFFGVVMLISLWQFIRKKQNRWIDILLFFIAGLAGFIMLVMWIGTDHSTATHNLNLLWALPTHLIAAIFLLKSPLSEGVRTYFFVAAILHGLFLVGHGLLPQQFHPAIVPLICALLLRSLYIGKGNLLP